MKIETAVQGSRNANGSRHICVYGQMLTGTAAREQHSTPPPPHSPQDAPPASCFPRSPPFAFGHGLPEICTARNSLCHLFHDFYARGSWHYKTRQDDIVDFLDYQIPLTQPGAVRFQNYLKINQHNQFENCGSDRFLRFGGFYSVCITTIFLVKSRLSYILCIYRYTISYTQSH